MIPLGWKRRTRSRSTFLFPYQLLQVQTVQSPIHVNIRKFRDNRVWEPTMNADPRLLNWHWMKLECKLNGDWMQIEWSSNADWMKIEFSCTEGWIAIESRKDNTLLRWPALKFHDLLFSHSMCVFHWQQNITWEITRAYVQQARAIHSPYWLLSSQVSRYPSRASVICLSQNNIHLLNKVYISVCYIHVYSYTAGPKQLDVSACVYINRSGFARSAMVGPGPGFTNDWFFWRICNKITSGNHFSWSQDAAGNNGTAEIDDVYMGTWTDPLLDVNWWDRAR